MFGSTNPFGQSSSSPFASQPVFGQTSNTSNNPFVPKPFGSTTSFGDQTGSSIFGDTSTGVFGAAQSCSPFPSSTTFGASSSPAFGNTTPGFGAASSPAFNSSPSPFGAFGQSSSSPFASQQVFGQTSNTSNNLFVPKPFGSTTPFGDQTGSSIFGGTSTGVFGAAQSSSPFPSSTTLGASSSPAFGNTTPGFGAASGPAFNSSPSPFGGSSGFGQKPVFGAFGSNTTQPSPFGSTTQPSQPAFGSSIFGSTTPVGGSSQPAFGATTTPAFGGTSSPAFGATTNPAFGATTTPAFGATSTPAFGATSTPAFGATSTPPAFGATSIPSFGATTTPAFGATSTPAFGATSTPAFGATSTSPAFGATSTHPAFGATSTHPASGSTTSPTFGSTGSAFGVSNSSVFGSTGDFGASSAPAFGSSGSTSGTSSNPGFGASSAPGFGSSSTPSFSFTAPAFGQSNSTFGQSNSTFGSASSPFGAQSSPFGAQPTPLGNNTFGQSAFGGQQRGGSRVAAYTETPEPDGGSGATAAKLESISAMPVYKDKSHEELRWEDYQLGDKGGPAPAGGSGFGMSAAQPNSLNTSSSFPQASTSPFNTATAPNLFTPKTPSFPSTGFGTSSTPFSSSSFGLSTSTNIFTPSSSPSGFGQTSSPSLFTSSAPSTFSFSAPAQTSNSTFNTGLFNSTAPVAQTCITFGLSTTSVGFGHGFYISSTPASGSSSSTFGTPSNPTSAASNTPGFGSSITPSFSFSFLPSFGQSTSTFASSHFGPSCPSGSQSSPFGIPHCEHALNQQGIYGNTSLFIVSLWTSACGGQFGGSRVAPYTETAGPDGSASSGVYQAICGMQIYGDKSHEELRWQDYQFGGGRALGSGSCFALSTIQSNLLNPAPAFIQTSSSLLNTSTLPNMFAPQIPVFTPTAFGASFTPLISPNLFIPSSSGQISSPSLFSSSAMPTSTVAFPAPAPTTSTFNSGAINSTSSIAQTGGTAGLSTTPFGGLFTIPSGNTHISHKERFPLEEKRRLRIMNARRRNHEKNGQNGPSSSFPSRP